MTDAPSHCRPRALRPDMPAPGPEPDLEPDLAPQPVVAAPKMGRRALLERAMLVGAAASVGALAWPLGAALTDAGLDIEDEHAGSNIGVAPASAPAPSVVPADARIQIALLLDTSSSMSGLIDQARSQLWRVVDTLDAATFHGATPRVEIAVYEYGNDSLSPQAGWVRQVIPLSSELDRVSEALFGLTTGGGSEHAGQAIEIASNELPWSDSSSTLKVLYIAGNESFAQGPVDYRNAVAKAREQGVVINTINCGSGSAPDEGWVHAAEIGGGKFFSIDHNAREVYVAAPQDAEIAQLGVAFNKTYLYFGRRGASSFDNQAVQDNNAMGSAGSSNVMRQLSKASSLYRNDAWDLVDAVEDGKVNLSEIDRGTLPREYRSLSTAELKAEVASKKAERATMRARLAELKAEREKHIEAQRAQGSPDGPPRLDDAIIGALAEQAAAAGFTLDRA